MGKRGPKPTLEMPWEQGFLEKLAENYNVTASAQHIGRTKRNVYKRRKVSRRFRIRFDAVQGAINDSLEAAALKRAIAGWLEPVYAKDEKGRMVVVGAKPKFSAGLTVFMLKRRLPDRYGDKGGDAPSAGALEFAQMIQETLEKLDAAVPGPPPETPAAVEHAITAEGAQPT